MGAVHFINYAIGRITAYSAEIDKKVRLGLLNKEQALKMKKEFSHKMDIFYQRWSESGDKWLKEKLAELRSIKRRGWDSRRLCGFD